MALIDDVNAAIGAAMKARNLTTLSTLRMLKTALVHRSVERGRDLDAAESLQVVSTLVKQRRDSIDQFLKGGRKDLADKEMAEISVLEGYLPPALDPAELDRAIDEAVSETGASSPKDLGRVMKGVMAKLAGRGADGKQVNERVRQRLSGQP